MDTPEPTPTPLVREALRRHVAGTPTATSVLAELVDDIDHSGGAVVHDDGHIAPAADPTWTDLGPTYLKACVVLGRLPRLERSGAADADEAGDPVW